MRHKHPVTEQTPPCLNSYQGNLIPPTHCTKYDKQPSKTKHNSHIDNKMIDQSKL